LLSLSRRPAVLQIPVLNDGIKIFYDKSSGLWERIWGEHMHHGFYEPNGAKKTREQAQIDMIDKVLEFAGATDVSKVVDVGCGIGGSSRCAAARMCLVHPM
jgi:tocopherol O-methyltransferase